MELYIVKTLFACWKTLSEMAPYLLLGFFVAGVLSVFVRPEMVERHLGGRGIGPVVKAALFGVPLPLCSCGVIPVAASLRHHGASRGATTAFLLSTPQTGIDSIFVTYSLMGLVFAVIRPIAAMVTGLVGGGLVDIFVKDGKNDLLKPEEYCTEECGTQSPFRSRIIQAFHYGFIVLPRDLGKAMWVGVIIAGIISTLVPEDYFSGRLGSGMVGMLVMMTLGIPVYVCATGSVPIAAALMAKGVSPGAALVFLMTGPATNAAAIATLWKVLGGKTGLLYLFSVAICSLIFGLILDHVLGVSDIVVVPHHGGHEGLPAIVKNISAVLLLAVGAWASMKPDRKIVRGGGDDQNGSVIRLHISGITCRHCVERVRYALGECPGVVAVEVNQQTETAIVKGKDVEVNTLMAAVAALGYTARPQA